MRIVHFSDGHGKHPKLPRGDVYVDTGDTLPNFRIHVIERPSGRLVEWEEHLELVGRTARRRPKGERVDMRIDRDRERDLQTRYLALRRGYGRTRLANKDAPVICVRGNHDFVDLAPLYTGGPVHEIGPEPDGTIDILVGPQRLRFAGFRGVPTHRGLFTDEFAETVLQDRVDALPDDLDVLVTHCPPLRVLDRVHDGRRVGSASVTALHQRRRSRPFKAHLFGHIHESFGLLERDGTVFSNAATGVRIIDL